MAREPDSIDAALERYERQRKPDVHALGTMDHQVGSSILSALMSPSTPVMCTFDSPDHAPHCDHGLVSICLESPLRCTVLLGWLLSKASCEPDLAITTCT